MKITLALNSGFCMGVRNAVLKIIKEINSSEEEIRMYGPLIHNPQTIDILSRRGLITIKDLGDIKGKQIAIRTHGVTMDENRIIKEQASRVINLTCPRVARVQGIIKKYSKQGYFTLITGDADHPEVKCLKSFAGSGVFVISGASDLEKIPAAEKYILVSQTTFDKSFFNETINKLKQRLAQIEVVDTICDSTKLRQDEVLEAIKKGIDTLVVVGGKNSANTTRLAEIGREKELATFHVETEQELKVSDFKNSKNVLITAGASTPGWIINNVLEKLYSIKYDNSNFLFNAVKLFLEFTVRTNLVSSVAAFFFTSLYQLFAYNRIDIRYSVISLLYIFAMYTINNYMDRDFLKASNSYKYRIYEKYGRILAAVSFTAMLVSLYIAYSINLITAGLLFSAYLFGFTYFTNTVKSGIKKLNVVFISKLYFSKIITGFGWIVPVVAIPSLNNGIKIPETAAFASYIFAFIFLRHALIDMIAYQGDLILGRDTLPIWFGIKRFFALSLSIAALSLVYFGAILVSKNLFLMLPLLLNIVYYVVICNRIKTVDYLITLKYELIVDFNYILMIGFYIFYTYMSSI